jgi:hypothetical protein
MNQPHTTNPFYCVICGDLIVFENPKEFTMEAFNNYLYGHDSCLNKVSKMNSWEDLPEGPLKKAYRKLP